MRRNLPSSIVFSPKSSFSFGILAVETVVMTLPARNTCFASWHANKPVPLTTIPLAKIRNV